MENKTITENRTAACAAEMNTAEVCSADQYAADQKTVSKDQKTSGKQRSSSKFSTMSMVQVAIFGAVICVMAFTPFLGYIPRRNTMNNIKKLSTAGVLCAVAVAGSLISFPVFGSKCAPVQHMVNIFCAVLLGPGYGVMAAFVASLIRNLLGMGSLMAFPGSMFGALICGIVYKKTHNIIATMIGEVAGTSILGGLCAYPVEVGMACVAPHMAM